MKTMVMVAVAAIPVSFSVKAYEYRDMAQFAQSICGDIPSGSLSTTTIKGAVEANAGVLEIVSGNARPNASRVTQIYNGIPLEKLPGYIPTVAM